MDQRSSKYGKFLTFILLFFVLFGLIFLAKQHFFVNLSSSENINLVYLSILVSLIGSSLILNAKYRNFDALKNAAIWLILFCILIVMYSYRHQFEDIKNRLVGELLPSHGNENSNGSVTFKVAQDGHYHILAKINGVQIEFLVDTGASDVVITHEIAKRIGINTNNLQYNKIYSTANGTISGAPINIDSIEIGSIKISNVVASVNGAPLDKPLLGMSFLQKLSGYEVRDGSLTIWK